MVRCEMCGMQVPAGPNGKCFLGHVLPDGVAASAPPTVAVPPAPVPSAPPSASDGAVSVPPSAVASSPAAADLSPPPVAGPDGAPFRSSVSSDLIAEVVAEVQSDPIAASPPADPVDLPAFTAPKPLGEPSSAMPFTAPRPLGSPAPAMPTTTAPPAPAPLSAPPAPLAAPPAAPLNGPPAPAPHAASPLNGAPIQPGEPLSTPASQPAVPSPAAPSAFASNPAAGLTQGTAALAVEPGLLHAPSHGDMFVVSGGSGAQRRAPNKMLLLVLVVALLGGAAFAGKSLFLTGEAGNDGVGGGVAQAAAAEAGSLTRAFVAEESHRYRMTATIQTMMGKGSESESFDADIEMLFTETVASNAEDGSTTLRYVFDSAVMRAGGQEVDVPFRPGMGMEVTVGPNGKVSEVQPIGGGDLPVDSSFYEMLAPVMPPGAKPGSRWSRVDSPSLPNVGQIEVKTSFHYVKDEGANAIIDSASEAPISLTMNADQLEGAAAALGGTFEMRGRLLSNGRQVVEKATGRTLSADADMAMTFAFLQNGEEAGRMAMKVKFSIGPAGVSKKAA